MYNSDKYRLQGVKIGLFDKDGTYIACGITDKNGDAIFDGIPYGKYYLRELEGQDGFEIEGDSTREITVCKDCPCSQVDFISVQRHGAIKVTKWGYNQTETFRDSAACNKTCNNCGNYIIEYNKTSKPKKSNKTEQ